MMHLTITEVNQGEEGEATGGPFAIQLLCSPCIKTEMPSPGRRDIPGADLGGEKAKPLMLAPQVK